MSFSSSLISMSTILTSLRACMLRGQLGILDQVSYRFLLLYLLWHSTSSKESRTLTAHNYCSRRWKKKVCVFQLMHKRSAQNFILAQPGGESQHVTLPPPYKKPQMSPTAFGGGMYNLLFRLTHYLIDHYSQEKSQGKETRYFPHKVSSRWHPQRPFPREIDPIMAKQ